MARRIGDVRNSFDEVLTLICWEKTEMNGNDPVAIEPDRAYIE